MLIGLQDFSHIYFVTASGAGELLQTSVVVGEPGAGVRDGHFYSLSNQPLAFVLA